MYDMSPTDYHAASDPTPVSIGKLSTKELHQIISRSDDQELMDAAAEELDMRAQEAHERQGGMGGWR